MLKNRMRVVAAVASALLVGTVAACSGGTADGDGSNGGSVTLSYFSWHNETAMTPIVKAFEDSHPDIKVDMSTAQGSANDYSQTLTTRIAGGQTPDVFHMSVETRGAVMDAGMARDLTDEPFMEGIDPTASMLYTLDDRVYGMSTSAWAGVLIYNKDLLKAAGYDAVPTEWDEFLEMGKALTATGVTGYMEDPSVVSGSFSAMLGGYYAAQGLGDGDLAIFDGEKTFGEVYTPLIEQWYEMVSEGVTPKEVVGLDQNQVKQAFMTEEVAMYRSGSWDFADLEEAGIDFATAPFPALPEGEPFIGGGPDSPYVISSGVEGAKLDAAREFLTFLNSAEGLELSQTNLNQISTSANFDSVVPPQLQDIYTDYLKTGKYSWINWTTNGAVMGQEIAAQWQLLIQGQATPADVSAALDRKWELATK